MTSPSFVDSAGTIVFGMEDGTFAEHDPDQCLLKSWFGNADASGALITTKG
jgi:hypothetical protein